MKVLDFNGLKTYDNGIKEEIKKNAYFAGTTEEYNTACSKGEIKEGMLIILTDDGETEETEE